MVNFILILENCPGFGMQCSFIFTVILFDGAIKEFKIENHKRFGCLFFSILFHFSPFRLYYIEWIDCIEQSRATPIHTVVYFISFLFLSLCGLCLCVSLFFYARLIYDHWQFGQIHVHNGLVSSVSVRIQV